MKHKTTINWKFCGDFTRTWRHRGQLPPLATTSEFIKNTRHRKKLWMLSMLFSLLILFRNIFALVCMENELRALNPYLVFNYDCYFCFSNNFAFDGF